MRDREERMDLESQVLGDPVSHCAPGTDGVASFWVESSEGWSRVRGLEVWLGAEAQAS